MSSEICLGSVWNSWGFQGSTCEVWREFVELQKVQLIG